MILHCKDCTEAFELSEEEQKFFKSKGLELPKRCAKCRKLKKMREGGALHG